MWEMCLTLRGRSAQCQLTPTDVFALPRDDIFTFSAFFFSRESLRFPTNLLPICWGFLPAPLSKYQTQYNINQISIALISTLKEMQPWHLTQLSAQFKAHDTYKKKVLHLLIHIHSKRLFFPGCELKHLHYVFIFWVTFNIGSGAWPSLLISRHSWDIHLCAAGRLRRMPWKSPNLSKDLRLLRRGFNKERGPLHQLRLLSQRRDSPNHTRALLLYNRHQTCHCNLWRGHRGQSVLSGVTLQQPSPTSKLKLCGCGMIPGA